MLNDSIEKELSKSRLQEIPWNKVLGFCNKQAAERRKMKVEPMDQKRLRRHRPHPPIALFDPYWNPVLHKKIVKENAAWRKLETFENWQYIGYDIKRLL